MGSLHAFCLSNHASEPNWVPDWVPIRRFHYEAKTFLAGEKDTFAEPNWVPQQKLPNEDVTILGVNMPPIFLHYLPLT